MLAAALDHKGDGALTAAPGAAAVSDFGATQLDFLAAGSPLRIDVAELTLLRPVATRKWKSVALGGDLQVDVERWTVDELDFLELSMKVDHVDQAPATQQQLLQAIAGVGLIVDTAAQSKTETVSTYLATTV